jgi:hypothetical protein
MLGTGQQNHPRDKILLRMEALLDCKTTQKNENVRENIFLRYLLSISDLVGECV